MYSIGMFSKIYQVTPKTLRHYDELGLLAPGYVDGETGYRYYGHGQAVRLRRILEFKRMGFSLPEILEIIDLAPDGAEHIVWFENEESWQARLVMVEEYNLAGVGIWTIMDIFYGGI